MLLRILEGEDSVQDDQAPKDDSAVAAEGQANSGENTDTQGAENTGDNQNENLVDKKDETTNLQDGTQNPENDNVESKDGQETEKPEEKPIVAKDDKKPKEFGPNDDILEGKGSFKYASVDELKADWTVIEESEYDISLDADQKTVSLKKKDNEPTEKSQYFDDGIMFSFEKQKPEHVSFYCKTDKQDKESCNFRLFRQGTEESMGDQWNAKRKINWAEVAIFFRFGFFRHFKINY